MAASLPGISHHKVAKHTKGDGEGTKNERLNHRVIRKSQFRSLPSIGAVIDVLFGGNGPASAFRSPLSNSALENQLLRAGHPFVQFSWSAGEFHAVGHPGNKVADADFAHRGEYLTVLLGIAKQAGIDAIVHDGIGEVPSVVMIGTANPAAALQFLSICQLYQVALLPLATVAFGAKSVDDMKFTKLDWIADAPGSDPTARFTTLVGINGVPFRLVAHRVQRPVAAGWIDGAQLVEDLPCDADGRMAVDGEGWKRWWQEFDAMPDFDDGGNISDSPPKPLTPPDAMALVEQHEALWSLLCNTDDPAQVWRRPEGAYLIFGWPVANVEAPGAPSIHVDLEFENESSWADGSISIEGVLCSVGGPVMRWRMKEQDWHPVDAGEEWIQKLRSAVPDPLALLPFTSQHQRVQAAMGPMSEGFAIPKKKIG